MGLEISTSFKVYYLISATDVFPFGSFSSLEDTLLVCLALYAGVSSSQMQKVESLAFAQVENVSLQEAMLAALIQVLTEAAARRPVWWGGWQTRTRACW